MCCANVVLPELSGPYISIILPLGTPPIPKAKSNANDPVGIASTFTETLSPSFIIEPLPKSFSIFSIASFNALLLSSTFDVVSASFSFVAIVFPNHFVTRLRAIILYFKRG